MGAAVGHGLLLTLSGVGLARNPSHQGCALIGKKPVNSLQGLLVPHIGFEDGAMGIKPQMLTGQWVVVQGRNDLSCHVDGPNAHGPCSSIDLHYIFSKACVGGHWDHLLRLADPQPKWVGADPLCSIDREVHRKLEVRPHVDGILDEACLASE